MLGERAKALLTFSARRIWSLDWNPKDAIGQWKVVTLAQSLLSKVVLICFAQALANVSPLLHDIFGKFVNF
jgi:hypothetical protein